MTTRHHGEGEPTRDNVPNKNVLPLIKQKWFRTLAILLTFLAGCTPILSGGDGSGNQEQRTPTAVPAPEAEDFYHANPFVTPTPEFQEDIPVVPVRVPEPPQK